MNVEEHQNNNDEITIENHTQSEIPLITNSETPENSSEVITKEEVEDNNDDNEQRQEES